MKRNLKHLKSVPNMSIPGTFPIHRTIDPPPDEEEFFVDGSQASLIDKPPTPRES